MAPRGTRAGAHVGDGLHGGAVAAVESVVTAGADRTGSGVPPSSVVAGDDSGGPPGTLAFRTHAPAIAQSGTTLAVPAGS